MSPPGTTIYLRARWILPISEPAIDGGVLAITDDRVSSLGAPADSCGAAIEDLGDAVVMPGLINAHTHLELSHLSRPAAAPRDLPEWLMTIIGHQWSAHAATLAETVSAAIRAGAAQCLQSGVTTVGDVSRFEHLTRPLLADEALRSVSFAEVFGMGTRRGGVAERLRAAADRRFDDPPHLSAALSPHAPYSIEPDGIRQVIRRARADGMRIAMHLAESPQETEFLQHGSGRFREMLEALGLWDQHITVPGTTPVRFADGLGVLGPDCLIAHGNYVDDAEIKLLCATGSSVAYCPRTHSYFRHAPHPVLRLLGGGVNVCIGTDSLASAPSLSILEELQHARFLHPELRPAMLLNMATINGARALGLAHEIGTLAVGKKADIAVFRCVQAARTDPAAALLEGGAELVRLYIDGRRVETRAAK